MIHRHAIVRDGVHSRFNGRKPPVLPDFRAFTGEQIFRGVNQVIADPRFMNLGKRAHHRGSFPRFLFPIPVRPIGRFQWFNQLHRLRLGKIINV